MGLANYRKKRNFKGTPEPAGKEPAKKSVKAKPLRFVIQLHDASRKHYDLRLELDGTMKSWAVPKGPSTDPIERRLAVEVEDHPLEYNDFEGVIPRGHYGAGIVMIWDEGTFTARSVEFPAKDAQDALRRGYAKGHMTFLLEGSKLRGEFALIRLAKGDGSTWLLVKKHDQFAKRDDITHADRSVRSGRTLGEIAANAPKEGKIWDSRRRKQEKAKAPPSGNAKKVATKVLKKAAKTPVACRETLAPRFKKLAIKATVTMPSKPVVWLPSSKPEDRKKRSLVHPIYDGYRALAMIGGANGVLLCSKIGLPVTKRFPGLAKSLATWTQECGALVLDGLIVPLDENGQPRRRGLVDRPKAGLATPVFHHAFYVYDLLYADGSDLASMTLKNRQAALQQLQIQHPAIHVVQALNPDEVEDNSKDAAALVLGSLLRAPDEPYRGMTPPHTTRGALRSSTRARQPKPDALQQTMPPMPGSRHQVVSRTARPGATQNLSLSNLGKVYWPKEGITKGDLIQYYRSVSPLMLPHLKDRPQSLNRHPNGIEGASFFQKEVSGHLPGWMQTATIASGRSGKSVTYALCQTEADLLCLANLGCIEINTWLSRVGSINQPDFVVFDLDPGDIAFAAVIETAKAIKKILAAVGAPSFCKTSGSRGLHIYVPVKDADSFDAARHFSEQVSREVHRLLPRMTSLDRSPDRRTHLIYLDYLQNRIGQTMAAVYSVRPKANATVSTPLKWSEVKLGLDPKSFTIATMPKRLARLGDLWANIMDAAVSLPRCQKALNALLAP